MRLILALVPLLVPAMAAAQTPAPGSYGYTGAVQVGPWTVQTPVPSTIVTGQVKIAVTGTAVRLPSNALSNGVAVTAKDTNTGVGGYDCLGSAGVTTTYDGTGSGYCTKPGVSVPFAAANTNVIYVNGAAGDIFEYQGN